MTNRPLTAKLTLRRGHVLMLAAVPALWISGCAAPPGGTANPASAQKADAPSKEAAAASERKAASAVQAAEHTRYVAVQWHLLRGGQSFAEVMQLLKDPESFYGAKSGNDFQRSMAHQYKTEQSRWAMSIRGKYALSFDGDDRLREWRWESLDPVPPDHDGLRFDLSTQSWVPVQ